MAQFDVYHVRGNVLVLDCQSDLLDDLPTRFVVPLRSTDGAVVPRLNPVFIIQGERLTMLTPLARGIDIRDIEGTVASLIDHEYEIKAALDMLVSGY